MINDALRMVGRHAIRIADELADDASELGNRDEALDLARAQLLAVFLAWARRAHAANHQLLPVGFADVLGLARTVLRSKAWADDTQEAMARRAIELLGELQAKTMERV